MSENALRTVPYYPGWYGRLNYPEDTMKQIFREALSGDRQLMMHVTADSSFSRILSLMKQTGIPAAWRPKRVRIEHNCVGYISPDQQSAIRNMGILIMHTIKYCDNSQITEFLKNGIQVGISPDGVTNPFFRTDVDYS